MSNRDPLVLGFAPLPAGTHAKLVLVLDLQQFRNLVKHLHNV